MKIWLVTVGEPLPGFSEEDRLWRSGYLARLLGERGHEVTWWASSFDHFRRRQVVRRSQFVDVGQNVGIQFLHGPGYRRNVSVARQVNHSLIAREFRRLAQRGVSPAVIVCSFPTIELSREAVRYGRSRGVPVFLDIRDLWPDEMLGRVPKAVQGLGRWLLTPLYSATREAMCAASGLYAISETYLQWGLVHAGRDRSTRDRVLPMGYTGRLDTGSVTDEVRRAVLERGVDPGKRIYWFAGTFVGNIDLGTVIEAARSLRTRNDIQFVLTGRGEREKAWREQAEGLENVVFTGWAGQAELAYLASISWMGLGAYSSGARMSLPNKLFEYMSAGLPVLLSLSGEALNLTRENRTGLDYTPGDPGSLARLVRRTAADAALRNLMSANATQLFQDRFSPRAIYNEYADSLEDAAVK